jgi:UDP-N-acetylmuramoylalanine--D-glutamate ligase
MFYNQKEEDIAILNLNNEDVINELKDIKSKKKYFSSTKKTNCYLKDNSIYYNDEKVIDTSIIKIPGMHNIENILGAISIAKEFNVSNEVINEVISNFSGVEHRLEFVKEINGVRFYNDTEATNIKCTQIALSSFDNPTIIILGGLERGQNFDDLIDYSKNIKAIIGIGECRERVREFGKKINVPTYIHEYLKDGFKEIEKIMEKGDVVLLSPASASWDQYKECEVRGAEFKELVRGLDGINKK